VIFSCDGFHTAILTKVKVNVKSFFDESQYGTLVDITCVNFGAVLREVREEAGLRQSDLAAKAKLDVSYISMLEHNHKSPTIATYIRLCASLGIKPSEMMKRVERATGTPRARRHRKEQ
jgi:ribosome-binding protein aMBF1 (putative translation factor)